MAGVFLVLDGIDGGGKSTQLLLLADWLVRQGRQVVRCRDPGGTPIGEKIRQLLLDPASEINVRSEMLLYMASRAQLVDAVIRPALAAGKDVLCDRFLLATIVYQGHAGGIAPDAVRAVGLAALGGVEPDWTGILDVDFETSVQRRRAEPDRIERRPEEYFETVRAGFLAEAKLDPERVRIINAARDPAAVHEEIVREVTLVLGSAGRS